MEIALASLVVVTVLWLAGLVVLWASGRRSAVRELALLLPNLARLFHGLLRDERVPLESKVLVAIGLAWIASPIDLIPEFIPVIGPWVTVRTTDADSKAALLFRAAGVADTHLIAPRGADLRKSPIVRGSWFGGLVALLAIAAIGAADLVTPPEVDFEVFYLAVVVGAAWWIGRSAALAAAVGALVTELLADDFLRPEIQSAVFFNATLRLVVYAAAAILASRLYEERARHFARDTERETFLGVLEREFPRPLAAERSCEWPGRSATASLPAVERTSNEMRFRG